MTATTETCPACNSGLRVVREEREVPLGQRRVVIEDEWTQCDACNEQFYTREQAVRRRELATAHARAEDGLLPPARIRSIRESLHLTQKQFEELLGVGPKTCVRWESGKVCQNVTTDRLIRLIAADRENVGRLAAINGVTLPDSAFVPGLRTHFAALGLTSAPSFPAHPPIVHNVTGTREPSLTETDEFAILEAAHEEVQMMAVNKNAFVFARRSSSIKSGRHD